MISKLNKLLLTLMIAGGGCAAGGGLDPASAAAAETAKAVLASEANVDPDMLEVAEVTPEEWPDSSLGCPQKGYSYLQVITPGYVVRLRAGEKRYTVHVAGNRGVIC